MKYGVVFPQTRIGNDPVVIRDFVQTVEGLGYHYLLSYEHVLGANPDRPGWRDQPRPYSHEDPFHEPFVLFGFLAGCTHTLELVNGVLVLPQRQTALVAKQAAEVDLLSGGRLRLGVGVGWNEVEFEGMGEDFHTRGRRVEEQVLLLRQLWTRPLVSFRGEFHTLNDVGLNPLPARPIPIWMGGTSDAAVRRMARLADGWMMHDGPTDQLAASLERLRGYLEAEGRSDGAFGFDIRLHLRRLPEDAWSGWVDERGRLGVSDVAVIPDGWGDGTPGSMLEAVRQFKSVIGF